MPAVDRSHYRGDYTKRAREVRRAANADPTTRCWRCNRTKAEHGRRWQAGHVRDGDATSPLRAECAECNLREGAKVGNRRRVGLRVTRDW